MVYVAEARNGQAKSDVKFVRRSSWDTQVDTGDTFIANQTVSEGMHHDLVIVGMIEEDWDPDFAGPMRLILATQMRLFDSLLAAVSTGVDENIGEIVRSAFQGNLKAFCVNDEILGVKRLRNAANPLVFTGDGSNYQVKFKFA